MTATRLNPSRDTTSYKGSITRSGSDIDSMTLGASLKLTPGTYVLFGYWAFNTGSSGTRNIQIALGESSSNFYTRDRVFTATSNWASRTISWPVTLTEETTVYVMGSSSKATSSGNLDSSRLTAVRLA